MPQQGGFQVPYEKWSQVALAKKVRELEGDLRRRELALDESMGRGLQERSAKYRRVQVKKKKKGELDEIGKKRVREMAMHTIASNLISSAMWIPTALSAGEYSHFLLLSQITNAVLGPIQMALQKRREVYS
tara:strand:+ start:86 stop:478 length:393 start_codon:yes stop_codon:yes gene_type:complete